jgi:hypothetical protein
MSVPNKPKEDFSLIARNGLRAIALWDVQNSAHKKEVECTDTKTCMPAG